MKKNRKRSFRKTKTSLAVRNARAIKRLKKRPELKVHTVQSTNEDIDTDGLIYFINTLPEGTGADQKIGEEALMKMIHIRGYVKEQGNGTDGICRIIIVRWKMKEDAVVITVGDVLDSVNVISHYHNHNRNQFVVYYDETFPIDTALNSNIPIKITMKPNCKVKYNADATGNETDCVQSAFYIITVSDIPTGANCPHAYFNCRMYYTDS